MSLNQSDNLFLSLVRCAVSGKCDDSSAFSGKDWAWIIKTSNMQGVPALVADGLQIYLKSNPNINPFANETAADKLRRIQWLGSVVAYERMYARHEKVMAGLARLYATKNIRMMVLKGYGLSLDWPVPNHRPVGDLDIYNFGKWHAADALVAKTCGIKIDNGHEHHTVFNYNGVSVENHYDFINTKAHRDAPKIEARLKAWQKRIAERLRYKTLIFICHRQTLMLSS